MKRAIPYFILALCLVLLAGCNRTPQQRAASALEKGIKAREHKDFSKALFEFRVALKNAPRDAEIYYQAALTYLEMLDIPAAYAHLQKCVEINPKHTGAQSRLAELFSASHDPERLKEAARMAEEVLKTSANDVSALNTLAISKFQLGDSEDAEKALREAVDAGHADERTIVNLALMRRYKKDFPGALAIVKEGVAKNPKSAGLALVLARMYAATNDTAQAEQQFLRAASLDPKDATTRATLASFYAGTNRPQDAEREYKAVSALPDPKYKHFLAMYYWSTGKKDEGIKEFRRLADADPKDREARHRLIEALRQTGREKDADQILQEAYRKNPKDTEALLGHAQSQARQGDLEGAANTLRLIISDSPDSYTAHYMLSKVYAAKRQFDLQRKALDDALNVNHDFLAARLDLSQSQLAGGHIEAALQILDSAPPVQKTSVPWMVAHNWALLQKGDFAAASAAIDQTIAKGQPNEAILQRAFLEIQKKQIGPARSDLLRVLAAEPSSVRALDALGSSYMAENNMPGAVKAVGAHAEKFPKSVPLQFAYSLWLSRAGRIDEAKTVLMKAKESAPDDLSLDTRLGELMLASGNRDEARKILEPVVKKFPKVARAQMLLGHIELMSGNQGPAASHYRTVIDLEPDNGEALNNLASILSLQKDTVDEALRFAQRAKELAPADPNVSDTLGWVLYQKGFYPEALSHLEAAKASPNPVARYHLAIAYAKAGDVDRARKEYAYAYKLAPQMPEAREAEKMLGKQ